LEREEEKEWSRRGEEAAGWGWGTRGTHRETRMWGLHTRGRFVDEEVAEARGGTLLVPDLAVVAGIGVSPVHHLRH
jgi:hypothetical protein